MSSYHHHRYNLSSMTTTRHPSRQTSLSEILKDEGLNLEQQLNQLITFVTLTAQDVRNREFLIRDLTQVLKNFKSHLLSFPNSINLCPIGSYYTGLCDGLSDMDIFVDSSDSLCTLSEVKERLDKAKGTFTQVRSIPNARIPLITFVHVATRIPVDLSFGISIFNNGRQKSGLIDHYLNSNPTVIRPLLLLIRYWSKHNGFQGAKRLKNYALTLLVFNFLTRNGMIESFQEMKKKYQYQALHFGYDKNKTPKDGSSMKIGKADTIQILTLAKQFFTTFANFDYSTLVICSLTGEWIPKNIFRQVDYSCSNGPNPNPYKYNQWLSSMKCGKVRLNYESPLCIQDPFDLTVNVAWMVDSFVLAKFKDLCGKTAQKIGVILNSDDQGVQIPKLISIF